MVFEWLLVVVFFVVCNGCWVYLEWILVVFGGFWWFLVVFNGFWVVFAWTWLGFDGFWWFSVAFMWFSVVSDDFWWCLSGCRQGFFFGGF